MILEAALPQVIPGREAEFEAAFRDHSPIIAGMRGYPGHTVSRCIEVEAKYLLLVQWESLEDHTAGFRGSPLHERWRALLYHFSDSFPLAEHSARCRSSVEVFSARALNVPPRRTLATLSRGVRAESEAGLR